MVESYESNLGAERMSSEAMRASNLIQQAERSQAYARVAAEAPRRSRRRNALITAGVVALIACVVVALWFAGNALFQSSVPPQPVIPPPG